MPKQKKVNSPSTVTPLSSRFAAAARCKQDKSDPSSLMNQDNDVDKDSDYLSSSESKLYSGNSDDSFVVNLDDNDNYLLNDADLDNESKFIGKLLSKEGYVTMQRV